MLAPITPFDDRGAIDENLFQRNVDIQLARGATGFLVGGCTGEFWAMSAAERRDLFTIGVKAVRGRGTVLAGTGAITAGVLRWVGFDDDDETALEEMWAVNVKAPLRLIRLALPELRKSGNGRIVNIASTDGKRYRDATVSVGYAMTKHALVALCHGARFAGWSDGVRVTALCPGAVETELLAGIPGATPSGQRMMPQTVADAVSFLLGLPDNASAAEFSLNARLESTL